MNPIDNQLNRLFRAAKTGSPAPAAVPYGLETRVLAAWRDSRRRGEPGFWDMRILSRGLAVAVVVMGLCLLPALNQSATASSNPFADYLQGADATLTSDDTP